MRTGFWEHLICAAAVASAVFALFPAIGLLPLPLFILGSLVPDVDHPKSIPRKFFRLLSFSFLFAVFLVSGNPSDYPFSGSGQILGSVLLSFVLAGIATLALEFVIPKHRGKIHSLGAGIVLGAAILLVSSPFLPIWEALILGASGFAGFAFHLFVDFLGDRI